MTMDEIVLLTFLWIEQRGILSLILLIYILFEACLLIFLLISITITCKKWRNYNKLVIPASFMVKLTPVSIGFSGKGLLILTELFFYVTLMFFLLHVPVLIRSLVPTMLGYMNSVVHSLSESECLFLTGLDIIMEAV